MMTANPNESGAPEVPPDESLIRLPAVLARVQFGRTAWLDMVKAGMAPQPVKIGRATFWRSSELQGFIAERIRASRAGGLE